MFKLKDSLSTTNLEIVIILLVIVIIFIKIFQKYYKYHEITSKLPTIYGLPLVGVVLHVLPITSFLYKLGAYFEKLQTPTFLSWLGMEPLIVTIDPEIIKNILNSEEFLNKANVLYRPMDNALPNGLITSRVFKWKHNRKLMNPSFTPQILQRFIPIFQRCTEKIAQHFDSLTTGVDHSIFSFLQKRIMEIAMETIMGLQMENNEKLSDELESKIHQLMERICLDTAFSPMKLGFIVRTSTYYKILEYLQSFLMKIISRKSPEDMIKGGEFFLNRALKYQQQGLFDSEDTITETYTMISGSYETTSTTLYSLIVMLAMHPSVQERLYNDIIKVISANEEINYEHFEQLPYMNMIISETLRLVPPIPFIGREALENCKLTNDVIIPRDFQVLISIFHLHRSKTLWGPNANKFNPNNFLPEKNEKRHPYAYIPYSKGVRNCIGWRYADISLKFMLIGLLRRYKFSTSFVYEDLYFVQKISLQYLKEPKIKITKRN